MDLLEKRKLWRQMDREIDERVKQRDLLKRQIQEECDHPAIAECGYRPDGVILHPQAPRRLCLVCGVEEEGWGSGYKELRDDSNVVRKFGAGDDERKKLFALRPLNFDLKPTFTVNDVKGS